MSDLFCFGCNYPGEEHDERCPEYVDVPRLVEQRDRLAADLATARRDLHEERQRARDYAHSSDVEGRLRALCVAHKGVGMASTGDVNLACAAYALALEDAASMFDHGDAPCAIDAGAARALRSLAAEAKR